MSKASRWKSSAVCWMSPRPAEMDKKLRDLIEIIQFTEEVAARIHGLFDEGEIFRTVKEEFLKSKKYTATVLLLTADGKRLKIAETAVSPQKLTIGEKLSGLRWQKYNLDLSQCSIYRSVAHDGETVQTTTEKILAEIFPRPAALLLSRALGYRGRPCILTPLKKNGKIVGVLAMSSTDLAEYFIPSVKNLAGQISTALELADEYHQRQQTAEKLNQLVESQKEFIAHVGHELRTPLSVIKAVVESEVEVDLGLINRKVDQTTLILKNLMRVSRLDLGQEAVQKTKFELKGLIEEILQDVLCEVRGKIPRPEVRIDCPEEMELHTDRIKLFEVLTNLLRNTLIHAEKKPQVVLKVERKKGRVRIVVGDKNPPISQDELKKIFGRFYRGRYAKRRTGSGLGLYISKRLVELMNGRIWAESNKDGNRFLVELPADVVLPNL